jgi:hypothetical protein
VTVLLAARASRPLALVTAVVVLVAFARGGWVPVGRTTDQTRPVAADPRPATDPGRAHAQKAGVDIDAVVDKVRHRVTPTEDGAGALTAHDDRYRARFNAGGFGFTLDDNHATFDVELRGVQRGGHDLAVSPDRWVGEANAAVRGLGWGMTEHVTARAGELEWDVVLARPLAGTGDLRLEADLRGLDGVATRVTEPPAWHFPLGDGRTARMGEMVVKDATGAELYRALPTIDGHRLTLTVPASVLARAVYPLTLDPTVGPEQPTSYPIPSSAANAQSAPAVAWDGTNFLVVWADNRSSPIYDTCCSSPTYDIYGARVNSAGSVLDPVGIPISTATDSQHFPAVAWNGTNFLVVWQDFRSGDYDIYGARVSGSGGVLDAAGIPISTAASTQTSPAVAWNGTDYLVVWQGPGISGARVSGAGVVLDPVGIPISTSGGAPAVAWNGTNFLVVWTVGDIYGARVNSAGSVLDPVGIHISAAANAQSAPAVAWNGTNFLVVWQDQRSDTYYDIYGARVSAAGIVLDVLGIPISTAANGQTAPAVAWNGTDFLVVWQDDRPGTSEIYGARVSAAGIVLDVLGIPISTAANSQFAPAVAWNGTDFLVVWTDQRSGNASDIYGARVSGAGSVLDAAGIRISTAANRQTEPAVAWNGTNFLVVWSDSRWGSFSDIYGARVSEAGSVLDAFGIHISNAANHQLAPAVAWNGTNFLVVWSDRRSGVGPIYGARVSGAGSVLDPAGIRISTGANAGSGPAVAWDGTNFLVVWQDRATPTGIDDIYGARVSAAGGVLDPAGIRISTAANAQSAPAVAWNGTNFLVVWSDRRSSPADDIYGARVSGTGSVLDPAGIPISTAANGQLAPTVASWSDHFLVVWQDFRSGTDYDIYGTGVSAGGIVAQPGGIPISTAAGDQTEPDLAVRYYFLVAWRDRRSGTNDDIYATLVSPSGVVEQPAGFPVASSATDEVAPAVIGGPGTTWRIAYQRFAPEPPYGAARVFLRSVSPK